MESSVPSRQGDPSLAAAVADATFCESIEVDSDQIFVMYCFSINFGASNLAINAKKYRLQAIEAAVAAAGGDGGAGPVKGTAVPQTATHTERQTQTGRGRGRGWGGGAAVAGWARGRPRAR